MNLVKIRKQCDVSQKYISAKTGLKQQAISRIEQNSMVSPNLETLIKYADSLGYELTLVKKLLTQELLDCYFDEVEF